MSHMARNTLKPRSNPNLLSIVIPCYNEEESTLRLCAEITKFLDNSPYPCEVILVNDGSSDRTIELLADW
ncbi:MAG: glycosyltransferase, partial [Terriglobales bacterium]